MYRLCHLTILSAGDLIEAVDGEQILNQSDLKDINPLEYYSSVTKFFSPQSWAHSLAGDQQDIWSLQLDSASKHCEIPSLRKLLHESLSDLAVPETFVWEQDHMTPDLTSPKESFEVDVLRGIPLTLLNPNAGNLSARFCFHVVCFHGQLNDCIPDPIRPIRFPEALLDHMLLHLLPISCPSKTS
eukprot:762561-Hanusia_phi.AAC.4